MTRQATLYLDTGQLVLTEDASAPIPMGAEAWYTWLEGHTSFRAVAPTAHFTVRKEFRQGGWYWVAYRRRAGKLSTVYLGRSSDLSLERLLYALGRLSEAGTEPTPVASPQPRPNVPLPTAPLTKFWTPPLVATRTSRPRLLKSLGDDTRPLVIVTAPAGYGKTTIVADWIATDQRVAAWVSLDKGDNDPMRF